MILNIISNYEQAWKGSVDCSSEDNLFLPASIDAYLELERDGKDIVKIKQLLGHEDFHDLWKRSTKLVWDMIQESARRCPDDYPDLMRIYSYRTSLLVLQVMALVKMLDQINKKFRLKHIRIEDPTTFDTDIDRFHKDDSVYYHAVASIWAKENGLELTSIPKETHVKKQGIALKRATKYIGKLFSLSFYKKFTVRIIKKFLMLKFLLSGPKKLIFYNSPYNGNLDDYFPANIWIINIEKNIMKFFSRFYSAKPDTKKDMQAISYAFNKLNEHMPAYGNFVETIMKKHMEKTGRIGWALYKGFCSIIGKLQKRGIDAAFTSMTPYGPNNEGWISEAFRSAKRKVIAFQHGGNNRIFVRSCDGQLFIECLADIFMQWGEGRVNEHDTYNINHHPQYITSGSPYGSRLENLLKKKNREDLYFSTHKPRVLYAPSLISPMLVTGKNILWDSYIPLFRDVCRVLDRKDIECIVKLFPLTANESIMRSFDCSHIKFVTTPQFVDYAAEADFIIVDNLGGNPIWEMLFSDKHIICYQGCEPAVMDKEALLKLKKRIVLCEYESNYRETLARFAENPDKLFSDHKADRSNTEFIEEFMQPCSLDNFWSKVDDVLCKDAACEESVSRQKKDVFVGTA